MKPVRALTYPVTLTTAQLAYLFSLVGAGTLIGGDTAKLFPADPVQREAQWQAGQAALIADGWLVMEPGSSRAEMNDDLLLIIEALAYPEVVVLTTLEAQQQEAGVYHYLAPNVVVELTINGALYQLVALETPLTMIGRLAHNLQLPTAAVPAIRFTLTRQQIEHAKLDPDPGPLVAQGIAHETAHDFLATLHQPLRRAKLLLLRVENAEVTATTMLGILMGANGQCWAATPQPDEMAHYSLMDRAQFAGLFTRLISDLQTLVV